MLGWLFGKGISKVIDSTGTAVQKVYRTVKGDVAEREAAIHDEQMAVLAQYAAEYAGRSERNAWDSFVDGLNRLPRPLITLWVFGLMCWPFFDPDGFLRYVLSLEMVPDELWTLFLAITSFFFGARIIASDIRKPKLSPEQKRKALEVIKEREKAIIEARKPLIVETPPTRKPPPPPWATPVIVKPLPPVKVPPSPGKLTKGRPDSVDKMIGDIIKREGGFVNDSADSGGATCWGITKVTLETWREGECSVDDVRALTKEEAAEVYRAMFYFAPSIDSLPVSLQAHVMDCCVNLGARGGVILLQKALNALGAGIREDGIIGPMTRESCGRYDSSMIHNKLVEIRVKFYEDLAVRRPKDKKFLTGWKRRANSFKIAA